MTDTAAAVLTTNEVADELGTDAKTLRKFFRSDKCDIEPVGQGKRYAITPDDIDDLRTSFQAWSSGKAKKADEGDEPKEPKADKAPVTKKANKKNKKKAAPVIAEEEDLGEDDADLEPTSDELEELDLELDD